MAVKLSNEEVSRMFSDVREFEKQIPGVRYGEDYPEFALACMGSPEFKSMIIEMTITSLFCSLTLHSRKEEFDRKDGEEIRELLTKDSPMRETLLHALYVGYRLGKLVGHE